MNEMVNNAFVIKTFNRGISKNPEYNAMFNHYFEELHNLAISSIEIENLPDEIEEFYMADIVFFSGQGLMIYDDIVDMYAFTNMNESGMIDAYSHGEFRYSYAIPGYLKRYNKWDSVIFRDRPTGVSYFASIMQFAKTLANLWMTREINLNALKTPIVIKAPKELNLSYKLLVQDVQNYVPILNVDNDFDLERVQILKLDTPVIFDKIEEQIHKVKMEALSFLGYDVSAVEKKERVQSADAQQNQEQNFGNRTTRLACWERACRQANKLWGLDLHARFRTEAYIDARNFLYMNEQNGDNSENEGGEIDE